MGEHLIKPYEISVWEDKLTQNGLEETKLAIIGSDTMTGPNRIYEPVFTKNVNGEKTLTFSLKYKYFDPYSGADGVVNPFAALLVNERKVKLYYDEEWYEFIIKDHSESSEDFTWTYSCTDAFVTELSKNGYNIEFSSDIGNNQGTALELAQATLKNTDWQANVPVPFKQYVEDPIYNAVIRSIDGITIKNVETKATVNIDEDTEIYLFYSYVQNQDGKNVQFILKDDEAQYVIDDKNVITATNYRIQNNLVYKDNGFYLGNTLIIEINAIETRYQANRLNYAQKTTYDPITERTVNVYRAGNKEVYQYSDDIYTTSNVVQNFIVNGDNFNSLEDGSLQGWNPYVDSIDNNSIQRLELVTYPELEYGKELADLSRLSSIDGYLKVRFMGQLQDNHLNAIFNEGFEGNISNIGPISKGDEFVFRWRAGRGDLSHLTPVYSLGIMIAKYTRDTPGWGRYYYHIDPKDIVLQTSGSVKILNSKIEGGTLSADNKSYIIDNVAQAPSTKYLYKSGNKYYYWDGANGIFKLHSTITSSGETVDPNSTFLPYYYVTAKAKKGLTQSALEDPTVKYGFFIYNTTNVTTQKATITRTYKEVTRTLDDGTVEITTALPTQKTETIKPKHSTNIKVTYRFKNSVSDYVYIFTAGTTNKTIAICKYDAEKGTISFSDKRGIQNYTIEYTEIAPIYFKDMQFTRCIRDANNVPITAGNIPTTTIAPVEHWYLKPSEGATMEDIEMYSSSDELKEVIRVSSITSIYNEEKTLSISASQSNCFNILQTIAETFECWVDLVVGHDENGAITFTNGKPDKYVYLREYVGKDNYTGFKYGINLQSIERTINSDEIVTKLIVDHSQSDVADGGEIFIGGAPSNPSGEDYILNFNYYYNQGLLDRDSTEDDRTTFIEEVRKKNNRLQELETKRQNLEAAVTSLGSQRNVFTEMIDSAQDAQTQAIEDFEALTDQSYEEYKDWYNEYIAEEGTSEQTGEESLFEEENVIEVLGKLYASSAVINNYTGILQNINTEYWANRKELEGSESYTVTVQAVEDSGGQTHLYVELDEYYSDISFVFDGNTYNFTLSNKRFDITINNSSTQWTLTFTAPKGYTTDGSPCTISINQTKTVNFIPTESKVGVQEEIDTLIEEKNAYVNEFNNKYIRYIVEGTWNSTDYIDNESYYLDALQVSNTSAQPVVSYTINVVEISQLEGFEDYSFDAGDKTYVEDTEFFGWHADNIGTENNPDIVYRPAREEVIVSEVEWHLDRPEENVITVRNYKTRFEDLFQRISAAVQTVQYNEATYAKITTLLDADGTLNQNVLLAAMNNIAGKEYQLTSDGSIRIHGDEILIQNLTNPLNRVILNSEGIRISSDGGNSWATAISGRGINAGTIYTGKLKTDQVIIGSEENPSFRWDKYGISAYQSNKETVDAEGNPITVYDLKTYVRYDEYGLYGIKNNGAFKATSLEDVKEKAHFAVTWDGFFIKNSYPKGGRVEITSDNDFRVLNTIGGQLNEKIKIGALEWKQANWQEGDPIYTIPEETPASIKQLGPSLYGIRISNNDGEPVFTTGDDGNITITGTINATGGNFNELINVGPEDQNHIIIDGREGINSPLIQSSNYSDGAGTGWMINKDGDAYFMNITARGAIKTAVFEYAEIEAVGGLFVFRPSSTIKSARISGNDLIVKVEKPFLFETIKYTEIENPSGNPQSQGWYEQGKYGYIKSEDTTVDSEKTYFSREDLFHSWCKISNYNSEGVEADVSSILSNNGLTHVYEISDINDGEITLKDAAPFVEDVRQTGQTQADVLKGLEGGALIDFGREVGTSGYDEGRHNYGIGVNSSDNTVNLPERAISLFETKINPNESIKVTYDYRGILGTLPVMEYTGANPKVNSLYHNYMEKTQGIYTDNMYIGDKNQYLAFYTDNNGDKHLKISARDMVFGYDEDTGEEITWEQRIDEATQGADAAQVVLTSTIGDQLVDGVGQGAVYARLYIGGKEDDLLKTYVFTVTPPDSGSYYYHLDTTNKTCVLKKKVNGVWVNAPTEDQPKYNYVWTFRDESGQPTTYNGQSSITGKAIYMDGDIVNNKIVLQCDVSD